MIRYTIKRLLYLIPILFGVTFLTFLMLYLAPSDPISMKYSSMATVGDSKYIEEKKEEKEVKVLDIERRDFTTIYSILEDEWETLEDKEKSKINQYLEKINDILTKKEEKISEAEVVD